MTSTRIFYTSDLHLDQYIKFHEKSRPLAESGVDLKNYDIVVIAGDLTTVGDPATANNVLQEIKKAGCKGIIILGNHDYYGYRSYEAVGVWDDFLKEANLLDAITLLHTDDVSGKRCGAFLNDILFVGGTLWTDAGSRPEVAAMVDSFLNDAQYISHTPGSREGYRAKYSYQSHLQAKDVILKRVYEERKNGFTGPVILVTHHCPTRLAIHPDELGPTDISTKTMISRGFFSDTDPWIDAVRPNYIICGHTHRRLTVKTEKYTMLLNAFGYPKEDVRSKNEGFSPACLLEV